jgi:hypothetical protein
MRSGRCSEQVAVENYRILLAVKGTRDFRLVLPKFQYSEWIEDVGSRWRRVCSHRIGELTVPNQRPERPGE